MDRIKTHENKTTYTWNPDFLKEFSIKNYTPFCISVSDDMAANND